MFFTSAAPAIKFPNVYGIDIPTRKELVAHNRTVDQVAATLGVDWLIYQDLADLEESVKTKENEKKTKDEKHTHKGNPHAWRLARSNQKKGKKRRDSLPRPLSLVAFLHACPQAPSLSDPSASLSPSAPLA